MSTTSNPLRSLDTNNDVGQSFLSINHDQDEIFEQRTKPHTITNSNQFYCQIRFDRQDLDFVYASDNQSIYHPPFPDNNSIENYTQFFNKYNFILQNGNHKFLGSGSKTDVYKVYLKANPKAKFAAKISWYTTDIQKKEIMKENRLLHSLSNGLYIYDIYDDIINKRLIFIQSYGKDMKTWWYGSNNRNNGIKYKFENENPKKQEWILKRILYSILLNLREIHNAGYIHTDIKPENILVTKKKHYVSEWIDKYNFHIIDYGLCVKCDISQSIILDIGEMRFGTIGYNAWELMQINTYRKFNHSIDLYALGISICELIIGKHILIKYNNFVEKLQDYCNNKLIDYYEKNEFCEDDIVFKTYKLKCEYWRKHFQRKNGIGIYNGDESEIRSIVVRELHYNTPYTTRFKNFISNLIRDNPKQRIANVNSALMHDLFYNI